MVISRGVFPFWTTYTQVWSALSLHQVQLHWGLERHTTLGLGPLVITSGHHIFFNHQHHLHFHFIFHSKLDNSLLTKFSLMFPTKLKMHCSLHVFELLLHIPSCDHLIILAYEGRASLEESKGCCCWLMYSFLCVYIQLTWVETWQFDLRENCNNLLGRPIYFPIRLCLSIQIKMLKVMWPIFDEYCSPGVIITSMCCNFVCCRCGWCPECRWSRTFDNRLFVFL